MFSSEVAHIREGGVKDIVMVIQILSQYIGNQYWVIPYLYGDRFSMILLALKRLPPLVLSLMAYNQFDDDMYIYCYYMSMNVLMVDILKNNTLTYQ